MTKLIIDTDPGVDDAMAIFYAAAAPEIELLGLTSIFGNVTTATATRNALRLLEAAGVDAPVAHGAEKPLGCRRSSPRPMCTVKRVLATFRPPCPRARRWRKTPQISSAAWRVNTRASWWSARSAR